MFTFLAALLVSYLPARHWCRFPSLPVAAVAPLSAVATLLVAGVLGIGGFMSYSDGVMTNSGHLQIAIAERQLRGELPETTVVSTGPMAVALLSPVAFMFLTPSGLAATYFVFTSLLRMLVWVADEPMGDPGLTMLDTAMSSIVNRVRAMSARVLREQAEGRIVPDRLYEGTWAGLTDADFVVVSARRKPDWLKGTTVMTADDCFTLGAAFDLQTADGLRTAYPLTRQRVTEVIRGAVTYDMPPLRHARKKSA